jgi:transcriptional regulator with XRE-family HTH domain
MSGMGGKLTLLVGAAPCPGLSSNPVVPVWLRRIIQSMGTADYLNRELARRRQRNSRYSLRAFARDLNCDHATLSQWLRGTRPMSHEAEEHVFIRLDMNAAERARARDLDDDDLKVLDAIERSASTLTLDVATTAGVSMDRANVALTKLLRHRVVRLEQSRWEILEEVE